MPDQSWDGQGPLASDGLFARARAGDQAAWKELFETCYPKVVRVIRRKLQGRPAVRSRYDSTDFASDVWKSLAAKSDRFDFATVDELMAFLVKAAEDKFHDHMRKLTAQRRNLYRELPLVGSDDQRLLQLASADPTPSQYALEGEARALLLQACSPEQRQILELRDQGYSNEEIAGRTGWHLRQVQRFLKGLREVFHARRFGGA